MSLRDRLAAEAEITDAVRFGLGSGLTFVFDDDEIRGATATWEQDAERILDSDVSFEEAVDAALETVTTRFEENSLDALRAFAVEMPRWRDRTDGAALYRSGHDAITSVSGGGRSLHRHRMRQFLTQARALCRGLGFQLGIGMAKSARAWTTLADYMLAAAESLEPDSPDPSEDPFHHVESLAEAVYQYESAFCDLVSHR